ncbi:MAG: thiol-disulfide oxidoreductase DCC family protein, partial [Patiriisocius sp.]
DRVYLKSTAALRISKKMSNLWPLLYVCIVLPKFLRDAVYDYIAKNRYAWFGKKDQCMIPSPATKDKFL